jgi:hypothetical protein
MHLAARPAIEKPAKAVLCHGDRVRKPLQHLEFTVIALLDELDDEYFEACAGSPQGGSQRCSGFAFSISGVNLYILFHDDFRRYYLVHVISGTPATRLQCRARTKR